jgi:methionine synthase I (cobalamin-dependent)
MCATAAGLVRMARVRPAWVEIAKKSDFAGRERIPVKAAMETEEVMLCGCAVEAAWNGLQGCGALPALVGWGCSAGAQRLKYVGNLS